MQKYRADIAQTQPDGAIVWKTDWIGGRPLAKIVNCRLAGLAGDMRRTVYALGEPDTYFSVPAATRIMGCRVTGYIAIDGTGNLVFQQTYY